MFLGDDSVQSCGKWKLWVDSLEERLPTDRAASGQLPSGREPAAALPGRGQGGPLGEGAWLPHLQMEKWLCCVFQWLLSLKENYR